MTTELDEHLAQAIQRASQTAFPQPPPKEDTVDTTPPTPAPPTKLATVPLQMARPSLREALMFPSKKTAVAAASSGAAAGNGPGVDIERPLAPTLVDLDQGWFARIVAFFRRIIAAVFGVFGVTSQPQPMAAQVAADEPDPRDVQIAELRQQLAETRADLARLRAAAAARGLDLASIDQAEDAASRAVDAGARGLELDRARDRARERREAAMLPTQGEENVREMQALANEIALSPATKESLARGRSAIDAAKTRAAKLLDAARVAQETMVAPNSSQQSLGAQSLILERDAFEVWESLAEAAQAAAAAQAGQLEEMAERGALENENGADDDELVEATLAADQRGHALILQLQAQRDKALVGQVADTEAELLKLRKLIRAELDEVKAALKEPQASSPLDTSAPQEALKLKREWASLTVRIALAQARELVLPPSLTNGDLWTPGSTPESRLAKVQEREEKIRLAKVAREEELADLHYQLRIAAAKLWGDDDDFGEDADRLTERQERMR